MKRKFLSVVGLVSTVTLFAMLQGGGTGGCGGSSGGGGGGTPTAGATASGAGSVNALTAAISSSLRSTMPGALVVKSEESGEDDLSCTCDDTTGICTCEDEDTESEGDIDCDFEDLPGEDDFGLCGEGETSMGSFSFSGTATIDNAEFDECGMNLTFSGTVSYSGSFTLDCEGEPTSSTGQFTTSSPCSGLTAVDEDGTSHTVGLNVTLTNDVPSGTICIDGTEYDASTLDGTCDEDSCEDECVTSCEGGDGGGTSPALKSVEDSTCEETCESACEDDEDGDYDSGGGTDTGSSCEDASVTDKAEARTQLQSYDVDPLPQEVSEAIEEACAASDSDVETFVAAFLCALDIDSSLASDTDIQEDVDNLEDIDTSDLAGTCADEGGGCTEDQNNTCKEAVQEAEDMGLAGAVDATTCVDPETGECALDCSATADEANCLTTAEGADGVTCEGSVCSWLPDEPMP